MEMEIGGGGGGGGRKGDNTQLMCSSYCTV